MPSAYRAQLDALDSEIKALRPRERTEHFAADPVAFAKLVGLELDEWQHRVVAGKQPRTILLTSRQAGKSTTAALIALHEALFSPGSLTLLVSPSLRQSSELFRKVSELRQAVPWRVPLTEDNRLSMAVRGGGRVVSLPSSESTVRGYSGVTLLVEDEAARVDDALHLAVLPMLAVRRGRLILMSSAWARRGHFFETWENGANWHREKVTVYDVPRISPEWIEEQKATMPRSWFDSEYACVFVEPEDSVFAPADVYGALDESIQPLFGGSH